MLPSHDSPAAKSREIISSIPINPDAVATMLAAYDELVTNWRELVDSHATLAAVTILGLGCIGDYEKDELIERTVRKLIRIHGLH